jgi:nitrogen fixation protein NifU and related proteins
MYSQELLDHFQSPRNVGEMPDADAEAEVENPVCGDHLHLWLQISDNVIQRASWQLEGCAPAIAAASVASEIVAGRSVQSARAIDRSVIEEALGGLPARKSHAALMVISAIRAALEHYDDGIAVQ